MSYFVIVSWNFLYILIVWLDVFTVEFDFSDIVKLIAEELGVIFLGEGYLV